MVGKSKRLIVTSSKEDEQVPFEIVQRKVFTPTLNPVTPDVGEVGAVIVPPPAITVHAPVPTAGVFPASVAVVAQTVWSIPATEIVGGVSLKITISSVEGVHKPFEIVQRNVLDPKLNPVTPDVGELGVVIVALPVITVQTPVPTIGILAARVAVVVHKV